MPRIRIIDSRLTAETAIVAALARASRFPTSVRLHPMIPALVILALLALLIATDPGSDTHQPPSA